MTVLTNGTSASATPNNSREGGMAEDHEVDDQAFEDSIEMTQGLVQRKGRSMREDSTTQSSPALSGFVEQERSTSPPVLLQSPATTNGTSTSHHGTSGPSSNGTRSTSGEQCTDLVSKDKRGNSPTSSSTARSSSATSSSTSTKKSIDSSASASSSSASRSFCSKLLRCLFPVDAFLRCCGAIAKIFQPIVWCVRWIKVFFRKSFGLFGHLNKVLLDYLELTPELLVLHAVLFVATLAWILEDHRSEQQQIKEERAQTSIQRPLNFFQQSWHHAENETVDIETEESTPNDRIIYVLFCINYTLRALCFTFATLHVLGTKSRVVQSATEQESWLGYILSVAFEALWPATPRGTLAMLFFVLSRTIIENLFYVVQYLGEGEAIEKEGIVEARPHIPKGFCEVFDFGRTLFLKSTVIIGLYIGNRYISKDTEAAVNAMLHAVHGPSSAGVSGGTNNPTTSAGALPQSSVQQSSVSSSLESTGAHQIVDPQSSNNSQHRPVGKYASTFSTTSSDHNFGVGRKTSLRNSSANVGEKTRMSALNKSAGSAHSSKEWLSGSKELAKVSAMNQAPPTSATSSLTGSGLTSWVPSNEISGNRGQSSAFGNINPPLSSQSTGTILHPLSDGVSSSQLKHAHTIAAGDFSPEETTNAEADKNSNGSKKLQRHSDSGTEINFSRRDQKAFTSPAREIEASKIRPVTEADILNSGAITNVALEPTLSSGTVTLVGSLASPIGSPAQHQVKMDLEIFSPAPKDEHHRDSRSGVSDSTSPRSSPEGAGAVNKLVQTASVHDTLLLPGTHRERALSALSDCVPPRLKQDSNGTSNNQMSLHDGTVLMQKSTSATVDMSSQKRKEKGDDAFSREGNVSKESGSRAVPNISVTKVLFSESDNPVEKTDSKQSAASVTSILRQSSARTPSSGTARIRLSDDGVKFKGGRPEHQQAFTSVLDVGTTSQDFLSELAMAHETNSSTWHAPPRARRLSLGNLFEGESDALPSGRKGSREFDGRSTPQNQSGSPTRAADRLERFSLVDDALQKVLSPRGGGGDSDPPRGSDESHNIGRDLLNSAKLMNKIMMENTFGASSKLLSANDNGGETTSTVTGNNIYTGAGGAEQGGASSRTSSTPHSPHVKQEREITGSSDFNSAKEDVADFTIYPASGLRGRGSGNTHSSSPSDYDPAQDGPTSDPITPARELSGPPSVGPPTDHTEFAASDDAGYLRDNEQDSDLDGFGDDNNEDEDEDGETTHDKFMLRELTENSQEDDDILGSEEEEDDDIIGEGDENYNLEEEDDDTSGFNLSSSGTSYVGVVDELNLMLSQQQANGKSLDGAAGMQFEEGTTRTNKKTIDTSESTLARGRDGNRDDSVISPSGRSKSAVTGNNKRGGRRSKKNNAAVPDSPTSGSRPAEGPVRVGQYGVFEDLMKDKSGTGSQSRNENYVTTRTISANPGLNLSTSHKQKSNSKTLGNAAIKTKATSSHDLGEFSVTGKFIAKTEDLSSKKKSSDWTSSRPAFVPSSSSMAAAFGGGIKSSKRQSMAPVLNAGGASAMRSMRQSKLSAFGSTSKLVGGGPMTASKPQSTSRSKGANANSAANWFLLTPRKPGEPRELWRKLRFCVFGLDPFSISLSRYAKSFIIFVSGVSIFECVAEVSFLGLVSMESTRIGRRLITGNWRHFVYYAVMRPGYAIGALTAAYLWNRYVTSRHRPALALKRPVENLSHLHARRQKLQQQNHPLVQATQGSLSDQKKPLPNWMRAFSNLIRGIIGFCLILMSKRICAGLLSFFIMFECKLIEFEIKHFVVNQWSRCRDREERKTRYITLLNKVQNLDERLKPLLHFVFAEHIFYILLDVADSKCVPNRERNYLLYVVRHCLGVFLSSVALWNVGRVNWTIYDCVYTKVCRERLMLRDDQHVYRREIKDWQSFFEHATRVRPIGLHVCGINFGLTPQMVAVWILTLVIWPILAKAFLNF